VAIDIAKARHECYNNALPVPKQKGISCGAY